MNLSNYEERVKSSFDILQVTFRISGIGYTYRLDEKPDRNVRWAVDRIILVTWIIPSRYHVPISRLEELKRLEVTERILKEL
jgi:hypothetical protein